MTAIREFLKPPLALGALAVALATPALAGEKAAEKQDIVVRSMAAMEQWQETTTKDLNRSLRLSPIARKYRPNDAMVEVSFTLDENGRAENVTVLKGNGNSAARRTAARAVRGLDRLGDVPISNPQGAQFIAQIIFASSYEKYDELKAEMKASRAERLAANSGSSNLILIGG